MKFTELKRALLGLAVSFAGVYVWADQSVDETIRFSTQVAPILKYHCASCHLTGEEAGKLALYPRIAWKNLVNIPSIESSLLRVAPGDPDQSYMMLKLEGRHLDAGGVGVQMPLGQPPLEEEMLSIIRRWISEGAPND